jgi:pimeloyl-ACP methyl ester carboxylesterase
MIALFTAFQRRLIYHPSRDTPTALEEMARTQGFEPLANPAGHTIAWMHLPKDGDPPEAVFIVFHGNAGFALHRAYYRDALRELSGDRWACAVLEYPGYGARSGSPDKHTLEAAAEELLSVLLERFDVPVHLIGESLGSGVATGLAAAHPDQIEGLLLVTPFTSLAEAGQRHFPLLPVRLLLRDNFDNTRNLKNYHGPVAVLLAARDRVIPAVLGEKLHDSYHGPRRLWVQPEADHNTLDLSPGNDFWKEMGDFLLDASTEKPPSGL